MKIELYGASGKLQKMIKLEKFEDNFGTGYDYLVKNEISGVVGRIEVRLRDLEWYEQESTLSHKIVSALQKEVMDEWEGIAEIQKFYPHKEPIKSRIPRAWRNQGIGTCVLKTVVRDLYQREIGFIYCHTPEFTLYSILLNNGFKDLGIRDSEDHLLKKPRI